METIIRIIVIGGIFFAIGFLAYKAFKKKKETPIEPGPGYPKPPEDDEGGTPLPDNPKVKEEDL